MNHSITTTLLLVLATFSLTAQDVQTRSYMERTSAGPKVGTAIGFNFTNQMEIGGFYQRAVEMAEAEAGRPLIAENKFYGAYFGYPLLSGERTLIKLNVRTGVSNGENFLITPSILTTYKLFNTLKIGTGIGVRAFKPTVMASLTLNLNNQKIPYLSQK